MIRITLGASGLRVSPIAFGTWQLSRKYWGPQDKDDVVAAIWEAFDHGVNLIDTAEAYGAGFAETVVGEAIRHLPRDEIVIATKVYKNFSEDGEGYPDLTARQIIRRCEGSLRRLGVDTIDIYFLHFFDPLTPFEETAAAMERLLQQGKVRALGLSNHTVEQIRAHRRYAPYTVVQPFYSLIDPRIEDDLLPYCQTEGLGVMIYSPLHMGLLSGKYEGIEEFHDFRRHHPDFQGERFARLCHQVRQLEPIAARYGMSIYQLVLAATLMHPGIHVAICGIKTPPQIVEAAEVMGRTISREDYYLIRRLVAGTPTRRPADISGVRS
jgi:aryl-alcohol dehydrogenase-like predicted oxidoreductase